MCRNAVLAILAAVLLAWQGDVLADTGNAELPAFTPERETAVLEFVGEHHPELSQVLGDLKHMRRPEYERAIRELYQTTARLAVIKPHDEDRYRLMLQTWQMTSRMELLAARMACLEEKDPELEDQLRSMIVQQLELQKAQVRLTRDRLRENLKNVEANLAWLEKDQEELIERRFRNLTNVRKPGNGTPAKTKKPATPNARQDGTN